MGTAQNGGLRAKFNYGVKDYAVGNHPLWELFRAVYQMKQQPFVIGGLALAVGYFWSMIRRVPRRVSNDLVAFTRREQMQRLSGLSDRKSLIRLAWPFKNKTAVGGGIR